MGAGGSTARVQAIAVAGQYVYIGGSFWDFGSVPEADYIARWDGTQWQGIVDTLGMGMGGSVVEVYEVLPIGASLYFGGSFLNAGGDPSADYVVHFGSVLRSVYLPLGDQELGRVLTTRRTGGPRLF